ncbi:MAG: flagellar biosynthesis protein FlgG, partial [Clostridiales bacterium]|nr:flagellar biosynthesis protein FlgG [Clostridiales bacterium]
TTLQRETNGMFTSQGPLNVSANYQLIQSSIEKSNVNMNTELTNMIAAQRSLQSCSTALKIIDSIDRKAASQIASI